MTATSALTMPTIRSSRSAIPDLAVDHNLADAHCSSVNGTLAPGHDSGDTQSDAAGGDPSDLDPGLLYVDAQMGHAGVDLGHDQSTTDAQSGNVVVNPLDGRHIRTDTQGANVSVELAVAAAFLDDIERTRIAAGNRLRAMLTDHGLEGTPAYAAFQAIEETFEQADKRATLELQRALRKHPLGAWVKSVTGVGEKQAARLLAAVGDPYMRPAMYDEDGNLTEPERPRRGPAEFWQYCGHGDPARSRRRKGQKVQFNPEAKMRAHLIAKSCIRHRCEACAAAAKAKDVTDDQSSGAWGPPPRDCTCATTHPMRAVYDNARIAWIDRDTTDGHKANHALRLVGKAVLKDLFLAAKAAA